MAARPKTIDEYLSVLNDDQRAALEKLRKTIRTVAPNAEECISYGLAAFRLDGKALVAIGAKANHCAFYPMSSSTVATHQRELQNYDTSKGTIRFPARKPLPVSLVRKLVKTRIAENAARGGKTQRLRTAPGKSSASPGHRGSSGQASRKRTGRRTPPTGPVRGSGRDASQRTDPAVTAFLGDLDHPLKREIDAARRIILGTSPEIREGIKWNAPSFRTTEFFATFNLRARDGVQLVFHRGAKVKDNSTDGQQLADPAGVIKWLAKERCLVTLGAGKEFLAKRSALEAIVREWIRES